MINGYTKFASTLLFSQVAVTLITGVFILRHFPFIHILQSVIALIIGTLLLCLKWRWTPAAGILYGLVFSIFTIPSLVISMFRNIDPEYNAMLETSNPFAGISFLSAFIVLAIFIVSSAGLLTNFRTDHHQPEWFSKLVSGFYGAAIMGILISLYLQIHWVTGINAKTINTLPSLTMKPDSIEPAKMNIKSGEPLVLHIRNESKNNCHILSFPELNKSVHMERGRSGLIVIDPEPGNYRYECKPHHGYVNNNIKGILNVLP
jgi:plastocyanin